MPTIDKDEIGFVSNHEKGGLCSGEKTTWGSRDHMRFMGFNLYIFNHDQREMDVRMVLDVDKTRQQ